MGLTVGTNPFVVVYKGNGNGQFELGESYAAVEKAFDIGVTDVDGDGVADIVVGITQAEGFGPSVTSLAAAQVWFGRGDASFVGARALPGFEGHAVADLDGDGFSDLVRPAQGPNLPNETYRSPGLEWRRGGRGGRFGLPVALPPLNFQARTVAIGDVDGDGKPDIVSAGFGSTAALAVQRGLRGGNFAAPVYTSLALSANKIPDLAVADLNGDGRADVVMIHRDTSNQAS